MYSFCKTRSRLSSPVQTRIRITAVLFRPADEAAIPPIQNAPAHADHMSRGVSLSKPRLLWNIPSGRRGRQFALSEDPLRSTMLTAYKSPQISPCIFAYFCAQTLCRPMLSTAWLPLMRRRHYGPAGITAGHVGGTGFLRPAPHSARK